MRKKKIHLINNYNHPLPSFHPFENLIEKVIDNERLPIREIQVIFVDNPYLKNLHEQFLNDSTETDIMTFNLGTPEEIETEIYISVDQAKFNAERFRVTLEDEIARLLIHGLLHLKGCNDGTPEEKHQMHQMEDELLARYWKSEK